jgi:hypothetical protein
MPRKMETHASRAVTPKATRLALLTAVALLVSGCAQTPFADDSFMEKIPDAIESSDLGITEAWADKGVDGFTTVLSVGGTFESGTLTDEQVQELVAIIVDENTIDAGQIDISIRDADSESIDLTPALRTLGADPLLNGRIRSDEARAIAENAG